jgi:hemin uptake protein HemP
MTHDPHATPPGRGPADGRGSVPLARGDGPAAPGHDKLPAPVAQVRSTDLLQGRSELQILHNGDVYRLTVTRAGKLILHK